MVIETPTIKKPKKKIEIASELLEQVREEKQIMIHCTVPDCQPFTRLRVWESTYIKSFTGSEKSILMHAERISIFPQWTLILNRGDYNFTLIFDSLPGEVKEFYLDEEIPEPSGFTSEKIMRNKSDVYYTELRVKE